MTDFFIAEEIQKMIKAMPKPRLLFKKGVTARGYFRPYMSLKDYTSADIFSSQDEITPVTVRFSSLLGDRGTADTRRNIKSMAVKFHSHNDIYDMICQNIPIPITNDIDKLSAAAETFRNRDDFDGINTEKFWEFISKHGECLAFALMLYSYHGLSDSYLNINMFSVNTYLWINEDSSFSLVRYKWMPAAENNVKTAVRTQPMTVNAAEFIAGYDPDRAVNEVVSEIRSRNFPAFELYIRMIGDSRRNDSKFRDSTLIWNEKDAPYMCAGIMVLDQIDGDNIDDHDLCFLPGNTVDGIELCMDEMTRVLDFLLRSEAMERGADL